jgi:hypothetical protein
MARTAGLDFDTGRRVVLLAAPALGGTTPQRLEERRIFEWFYSLWKDPSDVSGLAVMRPVTNRLTI